jgi:hypothetical protein
VHARTDDINALFLVLNTDQSGMGGHNAPFQKKIQWKFHTGYCIKTVNISD